MRDDRIYSYLTKNIGVRPLNHSDLDGNYRFWFNNSEVCRYNSHNVFPMTMENLTAYVASLSNDKTRIVWAIDWLETNCHLGNITLQNINFINRSAELALIIGEQEFWGRGISREAASLIIRHGFDCLNLNRVYCGTADTNMAMIKLALSVGMMKEGVSRDSLFINGEYLDLINFGILKREFYSK